MDVVARGSASERFEIRLTQDQLRMLRWLSARLNRSGNAIVRVAIERMHTEEQKIMLAQARGDWRPNGQQT